MALGMIILLAAFTVIDRSFLGNKTVATARTRSSAGARRSS